MHMLHSNRSSSFYFIYFIALGVLGSSTLFAQQLDPYRWKNRVLLIFTPDLPYNRLVDQLSFLDAERAGLADRDLKVLVLTPKGNIEFSAADSRHLYEVYKVGKETFMVILVGKDGTAKLRTKQPIAPAVLFDTIDAMPMRQAEIKRK
jgi:hypothetical protein